jgi:tetratricopeptide (TPR) repeat protein
MSLLHPIVIPALILLLSIGSSCRRAPAEPTDEFVAANNRAAGLMGQFDFDAAVGAFETLATGEHSSPVARFNLAIALMNRQGAADAARAEALLGELLAAEPDLARRARYALGLLLLHEGREGEALPLLARVADADPPDAFAAYFAGQVRLSRAPAEALESYRRAAALEPRLRSAHYGAFLALRRLQREEEATSALARFQALEGNPQALVAEFKYTRMGPLSEVVVVDAPSSAPASAPTGRRFEAPMPLVAETVIPWNRGGPVRSITLADIDGDGAVDVFIAGALDDGSSNAVLLARGDAFQIDRQHPLVSVGGVAAALWGDLDDDGLLDVVLCRGSGGTQIWRQTGPGRWEDVTGATLKGRPDRGVADQISAIDGALVDADHDGDLDVLLVNASGPNELLNNDGGWLFRAIGTTTGLAGDGRPSRGLTLADLDGDRDLDVIIFKQSPPHDVFLNDRVWEYRRDGGAEALAAAEFSAVLAADLDADGDAELYTAGRRGLEQWQRVAGGVWQAERLADVSGNAAPDARLAIADTDGDGVIELLATGLDAASGLMVGSGFSRTTTASDFNPTFTPLEPPIEVRLGWGVAHLDPSRGPSIVGVRADGVPAIWRPGPGRHGYLALQLTGRDPKSDQRRSNASGLGSRVALRTGSRWTAYDTVGLGSGPGQSLQPMSIGLGGALRADFVAITWSDGVYQTELALDAGRLHRIHEVQRQLSSCPVVFTWDGTRYRFVTDILGVGGIGFLERPGVYSEPYPREDLLLPAGSIQPRDGAYLVKIGEPMEEIMYLDSAALTTYDLPPGWQMALDERKAITGPVPTGAPVFYREERVPRRASLEGGRDVTDRVLAADLAAVGPDRIDERFIGLARPFTVTVEFDHALDEGPGRPVLLADGWVEYPYAQTVFAAWQAGVTYAAPTLEARGRDGRWRVVAREFGYPAGMPRQMALRLPALPPGTTALRLTTNQEIYWDRIAVVREEPAPEVLRRSLPLVEARLESSGFARRTTGPQRMPHYDYGNRAPLDDTRHPRGWYTAFGSIEPLVAGEDSAVAIVGPGEEVSLSFSAPADPLPAGWTRRVVLETRGWCKDMDLYTKDGETVEPLPGSDTPARARLHALFNTRYASGW